jgi:hypothetical protein
MSIAFAARTLIVSGYLLALGVNQRFDTVAGVIAVAIVAVWAVPLVRDRRLGRPGAVRIHRARRRAV